MSFLDKLSANVTNAGKIVSQKAKNMTDANSLSNAQRAEKRNIQEQMNEIARLYFEKYKDDPNAEFAAQIASIHASEQRIAEIQEEIEAVRAREPELIPVPEDPKPAPKQPTAMVCMQCGRSYAPTEYSCKDCNSQLIPQYGTFPNAARPEAQADAPAAPAEPTEAAPVQPEAPAEIPAQPETANDAPQPEEPKPTGGFCAYCGKPHEAGQAFCAGCGKKL